MMATGDPANAQTAPLVIPQVVLEQGELILLAIKPSMWFVLLASAPVLVFAALLALVTALSGSLLGAVPRNLVLLICVAAGCVRVIVASGQWIGRLYILTNLRVLRVRGMFGIDVLDAPLNRLTETTISATAAERPLNVGSLFFRRADGELSDVAWLDVARPAKVKELVDEAIRKRHTNGQVRPG